MKPAAPTPIAPHVLDRYPNEIAATPVSMNTMNTVIIRADCVLSLMDQLSPSEEALVNEHDVAATVAAGPKEPFVLAGPAIAGVIASAAIAAREVIFAVAWNFDGIIASWKVISVGVCSVTSLRQGLLLAIDPVKTISLHRSILNLSRPTGS